MLISQPVSLGTCEAVEAAEACGTLVNEERFTCPRGTRKFAIGDRMELFGLEEYPELNGQLVTITNYRDSHDDLNGYYIKSDTGEVERWLNFVWEKRLKAVDSPEQAIRDAAIRNFVDYHEGQFRQFFTTPFKEHAARLGEPFTVVQQLRPSKPDSAESDAEDDMYRIRFEDGTEIHAYGHEVCVLDYSKCH